MGRPGREGPVGRYRSGWAAPPLAPGALASSAGRREALRAAQQAVAEATVVLPLGWVGWARAVREGGPVVTFHPHFGPRFSAPDRLEGGPP
jgi:hypothetical protein